MNEEELWLPIPGYPEYVRCSSARFCRALRWECQKDGVAICNTAHQERGKQQCA